MCKFVSKCVNLNAHLKKKNGNDVYECVRAANSGLKTVNCLS